MRAYAIVLAAGRGTRLRSGVPKALVMLNGKPLIAHSLLTLNRHRAIKEIVLVASEEVKAQLSGSIRPYRIQKLCKVVSGGARRQDSVRRGLKALDKGAEFVLIHDGARPFVDAKTISKVLEAAGRWGAAIAAVPVKATIKKATGRSFVDKTVERSGLWEAQTPQAFKKDILLRAFRRFGRADVTDDATLIEKLKKKVRVVAGSYRNIKITTPEDLIIARAISGAR